MRIIKNPQESDWINYCKRPAVVFSELSFNIGNIIDQVRQRGDLALRELTSRFDKVDVSKLVVEQREIEESCDKIPTSLKAAIRTAVNNVRAFHARQVHPVGDEIETTKGVRCWKRSIPIDKVGFYIPGGTEPLFSTVYMLGVPAKLAGCSETILCSPPGSDGKIHPTVLFTAREVGIDRVFCIGGAQAIAALAFGTETIPRVDKIFGPGNQFVTVAKQIVSQTGVSIDLPAGPSEVLVIADEFANPRWVAADLLAQAEHGRDSQVVLVTTSEALLNATLKELENQLILLPRGELARETLRHSLSILVNSVEDGIAFANEYAPEHLILAVRNPHVLAEKVRNAGSVFLGNYSPEVAGDYASGTNHVLPTGGYARSVGGVSVSSFMKEISFQEISQTGLRQLAPTISELAEAEGLLAHSRAARIRFESEVE